MDASSLFGDQPFPAPRAGSSPSHASADQPRSAASLFSGTPEDESSALVGVLRQEESQVQEMPDDLFGGNEVGAGDLFGVPTTGQAPPPSGAPRPNVIVPPMRSMTPVEDMPDGLFGDGTNHVPGSSTFSGEPTSAWSEADVGIKAVPPPGGYGDGELTQSSYKFWGVLPPKNPDGFGKEATQEASLLSSSTVNTYGARADDLFGGLAPTIQPGRGFDVSEDHRHTGNSVEHIFSSPPPTSAILPDNDQQGFQSLEGVCAPRSGLAPSASPPLPPPPMMPPASSAMDSGPPQSSVFNPVRQGICGRPAASNDSSTTTAFPGTAKDSFSTNENQLGGSMFDTIVAADKHGERPSAGKADFSYPGPGTSDDSIGTLRYSSSTTGGVAPSSMFDASSGWAGEPQSTSPFDEREPLSSAEEIFGGATAGDAEASTPWWQTGAEDGAIDQATAGTWESSKDIPESKMSAELVMGHDEQAPVQEMELPLSVPRPADSGEVPTYDESEVLSATSEGGQADTLSASNTPEVQPNQALPGKYEESASTGVSGAPRADVEGDDNLSMAKQAEDDEVGAQRLGSQSPPWEREPSSPLNLGEFGGMNTLQLRAENSFDFDRLFRKKGDTAGNGAWGTSEEDEAPLSDPAEQSDVPMPLSSTVSNATRSPPPRLFTSRSASWRADQPSTELNLFGPPQSGPQYFTAEVSSTAEPSDTRALDSSPCHDPSSNGDADGIGNEKEMQVGDHDRSSFNDVQVTSQASYSGLFHMPPTQQDQKLDDKEHSGSSEETARTSTTEKLPSSLSMPLECLRDRFAPRTSETEAYASAEPGTGVPTEQACAGGASEASASGSIKHGLMWSGLESRVGMDGLREYPPTAALQEELAPDSQVMRVTSPASRDEAKEGEDINRNDTLESSEGGGKQLQPAIEEFSYPSAQQSNAQQQAMGSFVQAASVVEEIVAGAPGPDVNHVLGVETPGAEDGSDVGAANATSSVAIASESSIMKAIHDREINVSGSSDTGERLGGSSKTETEHEAVKQDETKAEEDTTVDVPKPIAGVNESAAKSEETLLHGRGEHGDDGVGGASGVEEERRVEDRGHANHQEDLQEQSEETDETYDSDDNVLSIAETTASDFFAPPGGDLDDPGSPRPISRTTSRGSMSSMISGFSVGTSLGDAASSRRASRDGRSVSDGYFRRIGTSPFAVPDGPPIFPFGSYTRPHRPVPGSERLLPPVRAAGPAGSSTAESDATARNAWKSLSPTRMVRTDQDRRSVSPSTRNRQLGGHGDTPGFKNIGLVRPGMSALSSSKILRNTGVGAPSQPQANPIASQGENRALERRPRPVTEWANSSRLKLIQAQGTTDKGRSHGHKAYARSFAGTTNTGGGTRNPRYHEGVTQPLVQPSAGSNESEKAKVTDASETRAQGQRGEGAKILQGNDSGSGEPPSSEGGGHCDSISNNVSASTPPAPVAEMPRPQQRSTDPFGPSGDFGLSARPSPFVNTSSPLTRPANADQSKLFDAEGGDAEASANAGASDAASVFAADAPAGTADSLFGASGTGENQVMSGQPVGNSDDTTGDLFSMGPPPEVAVPQPTSSLPNPWGSSPLKQPLPAPKVWPTKGGTGFERPLNLPGPAVGPEVSQAFIPGQATDAGTVPDAFLDCAEDDRQATGPPPSQIPAGLAMPPYVSRATQSSKTNKRWGNDSSDRVASSYASTVGVKHSAPRGIVTRGIGPFGSSSSISSASSARHSKDGSHNGHNSGAGGSRALGTTTFGASVTSGVNPRGRDPGVKPPGVVARFGFGGRLVCMHPRRKMRLAPATGTQASPDEPGESCLRKGPIKIWALKDLYTPREMAGDVDNFPGPASCAPADEVKRYVERRASGRRARTTVADGDEDRDGDGDASTERLLWTVAAIALRFEGQLTSGAGAADAKSPEAMLVEVLKECHRQRRATFVTMGAGPNLPPTLTSSVSSFPMATATSLANSAQRPPGFNMGGSDAAHASSQGESLIRPGGVGYPRAGSGVPTSTSAPGAFHGTFPRAHVAGAPAGTGVGTSSPFAASPSTGAFGKARGGSDIANVGEGAERVGASETVTGTTEEVEALLVDGRKEEAVEASISAGLWGLAFLIASQCPPLTDASAEAAGKDRGVALQPQQPPYQRVVRLYANKFLQSGTPLYTMALAFSGQAAANIKHGGKSLSSMADGGRDGMQATRGGGDEGKFVENCMTTAAAIISNKVSGWIEQLIALGDRLVDSGEVAAAHALFLVAGVQIDLPNAKGARLVLPGVDHRNPMHRALRTKASTDAVRILEVLEVAGKGKQGPNSAVQGHKLRLAMKLADLGYLDTAAKYVRSAQEEVSLMAGRRHGGPEKRSPYSPQFIMALQEFEDRVCVALGVPALGGKSAAGSMGKKGPSAGASAAGAGGWLLNRVTSLVKTSATPGPVPAHPKPTLRHPPHSNGNGMQPHGQCGWNQDPPPPKPSGAAPLQNPFQSTPSEPRPWGAGNSAARTISPPRPGGELGIRPAMPQEPGPGPAPRPPGVQGHAWAVPRAGMQLAGPIPESGREATAEGSAIGSPGDVAGVFDHRIPRPQSASDITDISPANSTAQGESPVGAKAIGPSVLGRGAALQKGMSYSSSSPSLHTVIQEGGVMNTRSGNNNIGVKPDGTNDGGAGEPIGVEATSRRADSKGSSGSSQAPKSEPKEDKRGRRRRTSAASAVGAQPGRIAKMMTKWLYPDAKHADVGNEMSAFYDEKQKRWVFPEEDVGSAAPRKPSAPPTLAEFSRSASPPGPTPPGPEPPASGSGSTANDPLAALMAPPRPSVSSARRHPSPAPGLGIGAGPPSGGLSWSRAGPPMPGGSSTRSPFPPPGANFTVFAPKPPGSTASATSSAGGTAADDASATG